MELPAVILALALAGASVPALGAEPPSPGADVVAEDATKLAVKIHSVDYGLETLIVRHPGDEKLPVALITHGATSADPRAVTLDWLRGWAHDMAHRGWLAVAVLRRGYGKSDGALAGSAGPCAEPDVGNYLDAHADDLEAVLHAIAARPDADMSRVLAIGDSAGGAAVLDLAARPSVHVTAVVNVSGGLSGRPGEFRRGPGCDTYDADLVWNFARFGTASQMPTLWLYAENDGWFRPGLVARMHAAYVGGDGSPTGAKAELVTLPPFGSDGHALFYRGNGRSRLLPQVDRFLRANGLPTWDHSVFEPLLARLPAAERPSVEDYLRWPTEKALALGPEMEVRWYYGQASLEEARNRALAYCKDQTKRNCTLAAENFSLIGKAEQTASPKQ